MSSHKKAEKIVPRTTQQSQELEEVIQNLNVLVNAAAAGDLDAEKHLCNLAEQMESLLHIEKRVSNSPNRREKRATAALFTVVKNAQSALLALTGAPGIISQAELRMFCLFRDDLKCQELTAIQNAAVALHKRFDEGCLVEPGPWGIKYDKVGVFCIGNFEKEKRWDRERREARRAARADRVQTPTAAELQAWFDLPSTSGHEGEARQ